MRLMTNSTAWPKPRVTPVDLAVEPGEEAALSAAALCLSSSAHIAGVSVSATKPEMTTETTMVMANCLYSCPVVPGRKAAGMNTAAITSTIAISELPISSIERIVASFGDEVVLRHVALDVLDHHDGVVDHHADGQDQAEQRQHVDREAQRQHADEGADQRDEIATAQISVARRLCRNR